MSHPKHYEHIEFEGNFITRVRDSFILELKELGITDYDMVDGWCAEIIFNKKEDEYLYRLLGKRRIDRLMENGYYLISLDRIEGDY